MISKITNLSMMGTSRFAGKFRTDLLEVLETGNKELDGIARDFRHHPSTLKIYSFLEQMSTGPLHKRVRPRISGSGNFADDVIDSRRLECEDGRRNRGANPDGRL